LENEGIYIISSIIGSGGLVSVMMKWIMGQLTSTIEKVNKSLHTVILTQIQMQKLLISHDAQVRGINPTTGENQEDRDREAVRIYNQVIQSIDDLEKTIEESFK